MRCLYISIGTGPQDVGNAQYTPKTLRACNFLPLQRHMRDVDKPMFTVVGKLGMAVSLETSDHDLVKEFDGQFWVENCLTIRGGVHKNPLIITDKKSDQYVDRWVIYIAINNGGRAVETSVTNNKRPWDHPVMDIFHAEGDWSCLRALEEVRWLDPGQCLEIRIGDALWQIINHEGQVSVIDQYDSMVGLEVPPGTSDLQKKHPEPQAKPEPRKPWAWWQWVKRVFFRFLEGLSHTGGA